MMIRSRHPRCAPAVAALTIALATGGATLEARSSGQIVDTVERAFPVQGRAQVWLKNVDGNTRILPGGDGQVRVVARKEVHRPSSDQAARQAANEIEVRIEQAGGRIEVEARYPRRIFDWGWRNRVLVHFDVYAPRTTDVEASSVDGNIEAEGLDGSIRLKAVDGNVTVRGSSGALDLDSVDGDIHLVAGRGTLDARSIDGDITAEGLWKGLQVRTTDGRIDLRVQPGSVMESDWSVRTTDGRITVALPEGFAASLDMSSGDGRIRSDHAVSVKGSMEKNKLLGDLNGGGRLLRLRSTDGNISLTRY